jgi:hypothetical protein
VGEEATDIEQDSFGDEPDWDAFQPYTGLNCDVDKEVFGSGDINGEVENLTLLDKDERKVA